MPRIIISGNINIETTVRVESFPVVYQPTTFVFDGIGSQVSAVGYNIAKALTTLGDEVRLLSIGGRDLASQLIRATLRAEAIADRFVLPLVEQTPQSVVFYDNEGRRHVFTDLKHVLDQAIHHDTFRAAAEGCDAIVLTNIAYNRPLLDVARTLNKLIATDVHVISELGDSYNQPFMQAADLLFMSGEKLSEPAESWAARVLERYSPQVLVIGLGARGALLATPNMPPKLVPAFATRPVVSTGGAGDALLAAFLHYFLLSGDPEVSLQHAVVFAGYKIGAASSGEGFLTHDQLEKLVRH